MSSIEKIHAVMSLDWQREPVRYPACDATELRYLELLASSARHETTLKIVTTEMQTGDGRSLPGTILEKRTPYGEETALVLKSPHHELEGMVIAKVPGTEVLKTKRPLFADTNYSSDRADLQKDICKVKHDLKDLGVTYPDSEHLMIDSLMTLLLMTHVSLGDNFYHNILTFSVWMKVERTGIVQANWI